MKHYPKYVAAAVQAAPIYMNAEATADKVCELTREAAKSGAKLIVFPESFIPGYPYWNWMMSPIEGSEWFKRFFLSSIDIPGPEVNKLQEVAKACEVTLVVGVSERSKLSMGTLYNTVIVIGPDGHIKGKHRKLVPTFAEKLTWGSGDGSSLTVYDGPIGKLGALTCGENTNTLARFSLLAQGEQVHAAGFIAYPFGSSYDMREAIKIRASAHSLEGKVFTIAACSTMSEEMLTALGTTPDRRQSLMGTPNAFSGIYGPQGVLISDSITDQEGIVYAEIDISESIIQKQFHDIVGNYNRFDVFNLQLNKSSLNPITLSESAERRSDPTQGFADVATSDFPESDSRETN